MNNFLFSFYFLTFLLSFKSYILSFIVLPFKTNEYIEENKNQELNITEFFTNHFSNKIYTIIEVGTPKKSVPITISSNSYGLVIGYLCGNNLGLEKSSYNDKSLSFYRESTSKIVYHQYEGGYFAQDSFSFYNKLKTNKENQITVKNISFIYMPEDSGKNNICGIMGLSLKYVNYCEEQRNIISNLNKLNIIDNYVYAINYKKNDEGFILMGEDPHKVMPDLFDEEKLRKTNALSDGYDSMEWKTEFTQIYFYDNGVKKKLTEDKRAKFDIDINYIIGTNNYKKNIENYFFGKYIEKNICYYEKVKNQRYSILICNKDSSFDINSFPNIYFYHRIFNFTFELTKEELFLKTNNKYIFLIYFSDYDIKYFVLGKIFFQKYLFTFNQDSKTIGFYNVDLLSNVNDEQSNNLFLKILGIVLVIICSVLGFFLAKKIYDHNRKRRINELNEQYEYNPYEKNDINYEDKNKNKILLEMPSKL